MKKWTGSAAICISDNNEILMVKPFQSRKWAVPSGEIELNETPEQCCIREVREETGYSVEINRHLFIKETVIKGIQVKTYYFDVRKISESRGIDDPDHLIEEYAWKTAAEINSIEHVYPEDKEYLIKLVNTKIKKRLEP